MKHIRGDDNIYGYLGGIVHDALEKIINKELSARNLQDIIENGLEQAEMLGLSFPKDQSGNDTIHDNWAADMISFAQHFVPPKGKFDTEEFFLYRCDDDHYLQGYIDLIRYDNSDGSEQSIYDWKTSSMYGKEEIKEHANQLLIYAMAKEQAGIHINEIAWFFLKYVTVTFMGKARANSRYKTEIKKNINRRRLIKELEPHIRQDLVENGYDEIEVELYMEAALAANSLASLPASVRENYIVEPCKVTYPLNDETRAECREWINEMIDRFEERDESDVDQWEPREFTKTTKTGREVEDLFFCTSLCSFRKKCQHLEDYKDIQQLLHDDLENFL